MRRCLPLAPAVCLAALALLVAVDAQAAGDTDVADAIAHRFPWLLTPRSLHEAAFRFPDGVKGALVMAPQVQTVMRDPPRADLPADAYAAWASYCGSTAIVRATLVESRGVLTTAKDAIFSRSRFRIDDVIKASEHLTIGGDAITLRPGGEVEDEGERLRVVVAASDPPVIGSRYLLELRSLARDGHGDRYLYGATIANDPDAPMRADSGLSRRSYGDFAADLRRAASIAPCPELRP